MQLPLEELLDLGNSYEVCQTFAIHSKYPMLLSGEVSQLLDDYGVAGSWWCLEFDTNPLGLTKSVTYDVW